MEGSGRRTYTKCQTGGGGEGLAACTRKSERGKRRRGKGTREGEEKERKEKEEREEQERLSKLAEETRLRLEEEAAAKAKAEAFSEPKPAEREELEAHMGDGKQDGQLEDGKDVITETSKPMEDGKDKLKDGLRINTSINSPTTDKRRPGPLDLTSAIRSRFLYPNHHVCRRSTALSLMSSINWNVPPPTYDDHSMTTTLTPYLQLPHLLSLSWLAYPILSLIFVAFRLQLSLASAESDIATVKNDLLASCSAAEQAATAAASLPRYMALATNQQFADAVNGSMGVASIALINALTAMEAIINFVIDMYRSTFLCFLELVVRGGLAIMIAAVQVVCNSLQFLLFLMLTPV
jgi:hypothetical protein